MPDGALVLGARLEGLARDLLGLLLDGERIAALDTDDVLGGCHGALPSGVEPARCLLSNYYITLTL